MRRALDITIAVALWFAAGGFLGGCGDDPCSECPVGTKCTRVALRPEDRITMQRWECLRVEKEIVRLESQ